MWIEIFKAGTFFDGSGDESTWTEKDLDDIVNIYNNQNEDTRHVAPVVIGHPETDDPAYGWVDSLRRDGEYLLANIRDVAETFKEWVNQGLYKKISIALYNSKLLKHVGFLGAVPPAIKGLKEPAFKEPITAEFKEYENEAYIFASKDKIKLAGQNDKQKANHKRSSNNNNIDNNNINSIHKFKETDLMQDYINQVFEYIRGKWDIEIANDILAVMMELKDVVKEQAPEAPEAPEATPVPAQAPEFSEAENTKINDLQSEVALLKKQIIEENDNKFFNEVTKDGRLLIKQVEAVKQIFDVLRTPSNIKLYNEKDNSITGELMLMNMIRSNSKQITFNEFAKTDEAISIEKAQQDKIKEFAETRNKNRR